MEKPFQVTLTPTPEYWKQLLLDPVDIEQTLEAV
jgi:hypothetical protein